MIKFNYTLRISILIVIKSLLGKTSDLYRIHEKTKREYLPELFADF